MTIPAWFEELANSAMETNEKTPSTVTVKEIFELLPDASPYDRVDIQYWLRKWKPLQKHVSKEARLNNVILFLQSLDERQWNEAVEEISRLVGFTKVEVEA